MGPLRCLLKPLLLAQVAYAIVPAFADIGRFPKPTVLELQPRDAPAPTAFGSPASSLQAPTVPGSAASFMPAPTSSAIPSPPADDPSVPWSTDTAHPGYALEYYPTSDQNCTDMLNWWTFINYSVRESPDDALKQSTPVGRDWGGQALGRFNPNAVYSRLTVFVGRVEEWNYTQIKEFDVTPHLNTNGVWADGQKHSYGMMGTFQCDWNATNGGYYRGVSGKDVIAMGHMLYDNSSFNLCGGLRFANNCSFSIDFCLDKDCVDTPGDPGLPPSDDEGYASNENAQCGIDVGVGCPAGPPPDYPTVSVGPTIMPTGGPLTPTEPGPYSNTTDTGGDDSAVAGPSDEVDPSADEGAAPDSSLDGDPSSSDNQEPEAIKPGVPATPVKDAASADDSGGDTGDDTGYGSDTGYGNDESMGSPATSAKKKRFSPVWSRI